MTKKNKLYQQYFLRLCKEYKTTFKTCSYQIDKEYVKKIIVSGVNWLANLTKKDVNKDTIVLIVTSLNVVFKSFLTLSAEEIANLFPPKKVYYGQKYQSKDYFTAKDTIKVYQDCGFHNNEELLLQFLEDLTNVKIWKLLLIRLKLTPYIEIYKEIKKKAIKRENISLKFCDFVVIRPDGFDIVKSKKRK